MEAQKAKARRAERWLLGLITAMIIAGLWECYGVLLIGRPHAG